MLESKRFAAIASEFTVLGHFEETKVDPCNKESELWEDVWVLTDDDDEYVGQKEVDAWKSLDADLELAQKLDLVFGD